MREIEASKKSVQLNLRLSAEFGGALIHVEMYDGGRNAENRSSENPKKVASTTD